jgi:HAD superfamily hydrolase (TIGR01509 family)
MPLVTIDFHDTLFHCDEWFQLEIASLPVAFLQWQSERTKIQAGPEIEQKALDLYRVLRQEVIATGKECDAATCVRLIIDRLGMPFDYNDIELGVAHVMRRSLRDAQPLDDAVELIRELRQIGIKLAVVSSAAYHPFLEWCLAKYGMDDAFSVVVSSASCGIYKSDPGIYHQTLSLMGASPGESVHIGDSHRYDVASAQRAGMRTILLSQQSVSDNHNPAPDAVIRRLGEAPTHLDRLLSECSSM